MSSPAAAKPAVSKPKATPVATSNGVPVAATGMPEVDPGGWKRTVPLFVAALVGPRIIAFAITVAIYIYGKTALYKKNITTLAEGEQGYLYLASVIFGAVVAFINNYPMMYKAMVMRMNSKNLRT